MYDIRVATSKDCGQMLEIYAPIIQHTITSFEYEVPSIQEFQSRMVKTMDRYPWLVCYHGEKLIGYAYAGAHRGRQAYQWSVELSVYIHPDYHRLGIGKMLYKILMSLLKLQGYYTALAGISLPNPDSVNFHEALGFTPIGVYRNIGYKFGQWQSTGWWERPIRAYGENIDNPTPFSEIMNSDKFEQILNDANNDVNRKLGRK